MGRVYLSSSLKLLSTQSLPAGLEQIFQQLEDQINQSPNVAVLFGDKAKLPEGMVSGDVVFKLSDAGVLQIGLFNGVSPQFFDAASLGLNRVGNAVLVGGTVGVLESNVTGQTVVQHSRKVAGGGLGDVTYTLTPGVGFTLNSSSGTDTSTISWFLSEP
jgi:hypothetical protein